MKYSRQDIFYPTEWPDCNLYKFKLREKFEEIWNNLINLKSILERSEVWPRIVIICRTYGESSSDSLNMIDVNRNDKILSLVNKFKEEALIPMKVRANYSMDHRAHSFKWIEFHLILRVAVPYSRTMIEWQIFRKILPNGSTCFLPLKNLHRKKF